MGNAQCCSAEGTDRPDRPAVPWAAVLGPAGRDSARALDVRTAPGASPPGGWRGGSVPCVPLFEGPDEQNRRLGYIEPGQAATALEESRDGRWVRVHVASAEQGPRDEGSASSGNRSTSATGLDGWVHARSVPQSVIVRVCERSDLGYPSPADVHAALSRSGGSLTLAVKELREQHQSELSWTPQNHRPSPRSPQEEVARALDASRVSLADVDLAVSRPERRRRRRSRSQRLPWTSWTLCV